MNIRALTRLSVALGKDRDIVVLVFSCFNLERESRFINGHRALEVARLCQRFEVGNLIFYILVFSLVNLETVFVSGIF